MASLPRTLASELANAGAAKAVAGNESGNRSDRPSTARAQSVGERGRIQQNQVAAAASDGRSETRIGRLTNGSPDMWNFRRKVSMV
jgi:hypothetical protein